jgi:MFS superfamily sulfate permease-like transporter
MGGLSAPHGGSGLGVALRGRVGAWAASFRPAVVGANARAGVAALGFSLPLALLLARQTGVAVPWLVACSIIAGAVVALFGGTPSMLAGPGVATAAAVASLSVQHGPGGLALACAACGLLQVVAGVFRLGRYVRLVPDPVIAAFVLALGGWVVLLALPHVFGLAPPLELGPLGVLDHLLDARSSVNLLALLLAAAACALTIAGGRVLPRLPVGLVVVGLATVLVAVARLDVPRLPDLPLAPLTIPALGLPTSRPVQFAGAVLVLWVLASAETLLSSVWQADEAPAGGRKRGRERAVEPSAASAVVASPVPPASSVLVATPVPPASSALATPPPSTTAAFAPAASAAAAVPPNIPADAAAPAASATVPGAPAPAPPARDRDLLARDLVAQDLVAHGLANLLLGFAGGVPATGALIRGRALARAGGGGAAAGLVHALLGLPALVLLLAFDQVIPIAAVAGVVVAQALPLLSLGPWRLILRASRKQAVVLAVTAVVMFGNGLIAGIETGLGLSVLAVLVRVARTRVTVHQGKGGAAHQVTFSGPITFLASPRLDGLDRQLTAIDVEGGRSGGVILDLRDVPTMDVTGARRLVAIAGRLVDRGGPLVFLGAAPACRDLLLAVDDQQLVKVRLAVSEADVDNILERRQSFELRAHVAASFDRFREEVRERYEPLFEKLAEDQKPHTLFIGCVDSRVTPSLLTGTHPGELFVIRCLGAIVVPHGGSAGGGEAAAIEYAVGVLGVRNIVVCGHSRCGAIRAVSSGQIPEGLDSLGRWLRVAGPAAGDLTVTADLDQAARNATVRQLANLVSFPQVRAGLAAGTLVLHAWFYDVGRAELYEWREDVKDFAVLRGAAAVN